MKLQQIVAALDTQIAQGDILGAFQKYAADNCVTLSNDHDKTTSKAQKVEALRWFFDNIATTNRVELVASKLDGQVSESQFVFDFTNHQGQPLRFNEVIRRTWKNDLVVEETYLLDATLKVAASKETAAKKADVKKADSKKVEVKETAAKKVDAKKSEVKETAVKETAPKSGKPKADKKPAAKSAKLQGEVKAGK